MTTDPDLVKTIRKMATDRSVYRAEAYFFVLESLETAMTSQDEPGHVSGEGLLDWIRRLGQDRYGVMAGDVFNAWGVNSTLDFGRIVFHLVDEGLLKKRNQDSLSDFIDKFNFNDAFSLKVCEERG
ncbi:MAG: putative repeat protein (TIGR04138 family) [Candidatus Krumholzibacteriia bacterium]|jgi:uncharacterized repeat protein (TIGR04138 family)